MKISFAAELKQFGQQGEKTGWTYFDIPGKLADKLLPGVKKTFRVKGSIDAYAIKQVAILPMGDGNFILPVNAEMRKSIRKKKGEKVEVSLEADHSELKLSGDFLTCLADEPKAKEWFETLPKSHQQYYSKWIESAKTEATKTRRIGIVVNGLARHMDYGAMLREQRDLNLIR
jgi:hypothetical protein